MTQSGQRQIEAIQQDLCCPQCQYNLRGLRGDVVTCPECGLNIDVTMLVSRQWTGPWKAAPGYGKLIVPVAWLSLTTLLLLPFWVAEAHTFRREPPTWSMLIAAAVLAAWLLMLSRIPRLAVAERAVGLSLLAHVLFAGYVGGLIGFITGIVRCLWSSSLGEGAVWLLIVAGCVAVFVACRRSERFIAERCIRMYLRKQAAV